MAYCAKEDLLTGDIPLAGKYGDGTPFVNLAADEIDAQIGHIYVTPILFDESTPALVATARPAKLLLKKINLLLASGRIILDMAAGGEDGNLQAYGKSMHDEAVLLLNDITSGKIVLAGAPLLPDPDGSTADNGPTIAQDDSYSLVEGFYERYSRNHVFPPAYVPPMRPYDDQPPAAV